MRRTNQMMMITYANELLQIQLKKRAKNEKLIFQTCESVSLCAREMQQTVKLGWIYGDGVRVLRFVVRDVQEGHIFRVLT